MSYLRFYPGEEPSAEDPPYSTRFRTREEEIAAIKKHSVADIVVVGGGIHGACVARLAALYGLRVILLERADYASGTSSRSSKMAHGGLRYLELLDFRQVFEGIKAREDLLQTAPHLVRPQEFFFPIMASDGWLKPKLRAGFFLYDWFAKSPERRAHWRDGNPYIPSGQGQWELQPWRGKLCGGFSYFDGVMNDTRLVIENIIAARQEGAYCLNYARVDSVGTLSSGAVTVGWTDVLRQEHHELTTGIVINCAGPWAPFVGRLRRDDNPCAYSQGSHLVFRNKWLGPALILPMGERGRYYFIWPFEDLTLVGTTEREITKLEDDPKPTADEIEELFTRLARDVPDAGLNRTKLISTFAGVRTLARRREARGKSVAELSRRHRWEYQAGVLSLYGGKFTTALWTAAEGLKRAFELAEIDRPIGPIFGRPLPGAFTAQNGRVALERELIGNGVAEELARRLVGRLGSRVLYLPSEENGLEPIGEESVLGELTIASRVEQAVTTDDLLKRRLVVGYDPEREALVKEVLSKVAHKFQPVAAKELGTPTSKF